MGVGDGSGRNADLAFGFLDDGDELEAWIDAGGLGYCENAVADVLCLFWPVALLVDVGCSVAVLPGILKC